MKYFNISSKSLLRMAATVYEWENCSAELAIIISYPTSASGIIILLKTATKYQPPGGGKKSDPGNEFDIP